MAGCPGTTGPVRTDRKSGWVFEGAIEVFISPCVELCVYTTGDRWFGIMAV